MNGIRDWISLPTHITQISDSNKKHFRIIFLILALLDTETVQGQELFWARKAGLGGSDIASDISLDGLGNVLITGRIWGDADFSEAVSISSSGTNDIFVAKYSSEGTLLWARRAGSPHTYTYTDGDDSEDGESGFSISTDTFGNVLVAGQFVGTADFDRISISTGIIPGPTTANHQSPFVAKYDSSGRPLWVRRFEGFGARGGRAGGGTGVGADRLGNVYFAGTASYECDPPDESGSRGCGSYAFLEKYDSSGHIVWRKHLGGRTNQWISDLAVDRSGNAIICGGFSRIVQLDDVTSLTTDDSGGFYIAKYGPDGELLWAKKTEGNDFAQYANSVAFDHAGNVLVTGSFRGRLIFDSRRELSSRGGSDVFVAKYSSSGDFQWANSGGGSFDRPRVVSTDYGTSVATDGSGNIFIGGVFQQNASFEGIRIDAEGSNDGFIAKYSPDGSLYWVKRVGSTSYSVVKGIVASNEGRIFSAGYFAGIFGEGEITLRSTGSFADIWLSEIGREPRSDDGGLTEIGVDSWEHIHALCPAEARRALLDPDARCPGVFENSPSAPVRGDPHLVVPRGAEEIWTMVIMDRSLHSSDDIDHYRIELPDPGSSIYPGHEDIRPSEGPFREDSPQPMPECDFLERLDPGPGGLNRTTNLSVVGTLTIQVVPTINSLSDRPIGTDGEGLKIYRGDALDDTLANGTRLQLTVLCPRSSSGLRNLNFTFGERDGFRSSGATGGYHVQLEYKLKIQREIPDWVREDSDRRGFRGIGSIPCLQLSPLTGFSLGPVPDFLPYESFPFCAYGGIDRVRIKLPHPLDVSRSRDMTGQPPFTELLSLRWPPTDKPFDLIFTSGTDLSFKLYDSNHKQVGQSIPINQKLEDKTSANEISKNLNKIDKPTEAKFESSRLFIKKLPSGIYFLEIEGAPAEYTLGYIQPTVIYRVPKEFLEFYMDRQK